MKYVPFLFLFLLNSEILSYIALLGIMIIFLGSIVAEAERSKTE